MFPARNVYAICSLTATYLRIMREVDLPPSFSPPIEHVVFNMIVFVLPPLELRLTRFDLFNWLPHVDGYSDMFSFVPHAELANIQLCFLR